MRRQILTTLARRAYRRPPTAQDVDDADGLLRRGPQGRHVRGRDRAGAAAAAGEPAVPRARRKRAGDRARGPGLSHHRSRTGVAFVVLPVEQHSGRRADHRGERRDGSSSPAVLEQQVRRMLARSAIGRAGRRTSRSSCCICATCRRRRRTASSIPNWDDELRQSFRRETELFFESIMREDRNILDLLTADYTFVNERLAQALRHSRTSTGRSSAA